MLDTSAASSSTTGSSKAEAARQASRECDDALAERRASAPKTRTAAAGAPAGAPKRKKAGKRKPAGSRWLNYLLALGCLASLLPLWFEYRGHKNEPFVQPHKDDPWVRAQQRRARRRAAAL
tara:strand:+ start:172 stop:534 length:363 start_codon:yes stop_codon:yes gene_type:complete